MKNRTSAPVWLMASLFVMGAATGAGSGCAKDLDTSRESVDKGSFGETLVTLVCKRIAYIEDLEDNDGRVDVSGERYRATCRGLEQPPADAPAEIHAIAAHRERLIAAIDAMWPQAMLDDVQEFATSDEFLAAYDDGTIENAMIALRDMLQELAPRTDMLQVFERLSLREGYTPGASGTLASILSSPDLANVLRYTSDDIAPGGSAHDALVLVAEAAALELQDLEAPANPQDPESTQNLLLDLLLAQHGSLSTQTPLLLAARDHRGIAVIEPLATGVLPAPFIDADGDGLADVDELGRYVDATGAVIDAPTPLPTADPDPEGTVRDELGRAIETGVSQLPLYRYIYPDDTLLVALARDAGALLHPDRGTGIDLVRGAGALLGPRTTTTRDYGDRTLEYSGFDTAQSPILDALYGGLQVLRSANVGDVLGLGRVMLTDHELTAAELAEALVNTLRVPGELGELGDRAKLEDDSRLVDDLVPVIEQILDWRDPETNEPLPLLEDLLKALKDPKVVQLGGYFRDYMRYADQIGYSDVDNPDTPVLDIELVNIDTGMPATDFGVEVDRSASDSGFNRSIFQRVLHLLADVNAMPDVSPEIPGTQALCNKQGTTLQILTRTLTYDECELLQIDNLAVFYVQSLAYVRDANGNFITDLGQIDPTIGERICDYSEPGDTGEFVRKARLILNWNDTFVETVFNEDEGLEQALGIEGLGGCPRPEALNHLLFVDVPNDGRFLLPVSDLIEEPANRFGEFIKEKHKGSVAAWEMGEFYDLVQPLAQPFVDHGAEQIFVDLLVVLNNHWPSRESESYQQEDPEATNYAYASNLVSFEPIVVEVLDRNLLFPALAEGAGVLDALTVNGKSAVQVLRETGKFVLEPLPGLTTRTGASTLTRPGGEQVTELAPWHLLAQGIGGLFDALDAGGERVEAFEDGLSEAVDLFVRAAPDSEGNYHFTNPRVRGVGLILLDFLGARLAAHPAGPDRDAWLSQELPADAEELLGGPLVAGASDMVDALAADPLARTAVEGLLAYAFDESRDPNAFATMVTATIDLLQLVLRAQGELVPVAHGIGAVVDPDRGWLDPLLTMAARTGQADDVNVLAQTLRNLVTEHEPGRTPIGDIIEGIAAVQRVQPLEDLDERYTAADYAEMLTGIAGFIEDEKRGLMKFIRIIQGRNLPQ